MTLRYIYLRCKYFYLEFRSKIARIITGIAEKHLWFRNLYGWYFRRFKFKETKEYGSCMRVKTVDLYDDKAMAEKFSWLIKMLIPEHLHHKIEYLKSKSNSIFPSFDTIGWIYDGCTGE